MLRTICGFIQARSILDTDFGSFCNVGVMTRHILAELNPLLVRRRFKGLAQDCLDDQEDPYAWCSEESA